MTVLITGAQGQVGLELTIRGGAQTVALSRERLDLTNRSAVNDALLQHHPQVVINAAAYTAVDKAEEDSSAAFAANRDGPENLAWACQRHDIPLFHLSTDYVFDGRKPTPYDENDHVNPQGVYARSKWEGEQRIRTILQKHLILRVSWVFSSHGQNFVKTILRLAQTNSLLRVVQDQQGGPTPASDIAIALLELAHRTEHGQELAWGTYHFAGGPATTWHGFATAIVERAKQKGLLSVAPDIKPITTSEYPLPAARPPNSVLDCTRAIQKLGLSPPDWRSGLDDVLTAIAEQKN